MLKYSRDQLLTSIFFKGLCSYTNISCYQCFRWLTQQQCSLHVSLQLIPASSWFPFGKELWLRADLQLIIPSAEPPPHASLLPNLMGVSICLWQPFVSCFHQIYFHSEGPIQHWDYLKLLSLTVYFMPTFLHIQNMLDTNSLGGGSLNKLVTWTNSKLPVARWCGRWFQICADMFKTFNRIASPGWELL